MKKLRKKSLPPLLPPKGPEFPDDLHVPFGEELLAEIGRRYSRRHLIYMAQHHLFPKPVADSPSRTSWILGELRAWRRSRPVATKYRESEVKAEA